MEVRILHKFHDRADFTKVYPVGETFTFDDVRAEHLIKRGLAEPAESVEEKSIEEAPIVEAVEPETEVVEESAEDVTEAIEPAVEEAVVKPVATKRRSASKDN